MAPPLDDGAVQATVTDVAPAFVAMPTVGAPGTVTSGVTDIDAPDAADVPTEFVAVTVNV